MHTRDEHWSGLGLDWIRAMKYFAGFGLGPDCKLLRKYRIRPELDYVFGKITKKLRDFVVENPFFVHYLDFICAWIVNFLNFLDNGWNWTE